MIGNTRKHLEPLGSARKLWGRVKYCLNSKHIVWASGMFLFINIYINSHPPHSSNCHFTCPSTPSLIFDSPPPPIVTTAVPPWNTCTFCMHIQKVCVFLFLFFFFTVYPGTHVRKYLPFLILFIFYFHFCYFLFTFE
jgi:hypothetical protein